MKGKEAIARTEQSITESYQEAVPPASGRQPSIFAFARTSYISTYYRTTRTTGARSALSTGVLPFPMWSMLCTQGTGTNREIFRGEEILSSFTPLIFFPGIHSIFPKTRLWYSDWVSRKMYFFYITWTKPVFIFQAGFPREIRNLTAHSINKHGMGTWEPNTEAWHGPERQSSITNSKLCFARGICWLHQLLYNTTVTDFSALDQ